MAVIHELHLADADVAWIETHLERRAALIAMGIDIVKTEDRILANVLGAFKAGKKKRGKKNVAERL